MVPDTRPTICLTDDSRSSLPRRPRKYFWATMFVAFWLQVTGNSTPRCSNAGFSGLPMTASRISHSTASKGWSPGSVNRRSTATPSVLISVAAVLRLSGIRTSPQRLFRVIPPN